MDLHLLYKVWHDGIAPPVDTDLTGVVRRVHSMSASAKPAARKRVTPRQAPGEDFVEALAHGLAVLECWRDDDRWLTNSELAQRSGLTRTMVSRLTSVLVDMGFLVREGARGPVRLGVQTLALGFASAFAQVPASAAQPQLARLAEDLDVYAALSVRRGDRIQILQNVVSPYHPDAVAMDVGGELPLCRSASGLAAMSALPERVASPLIQRLSAHYGERWSSLERQVIRTKQEYSRKGYCTAVANLSRDVGAVAVPLVVPGSPDIFVLACGMPAQDFYHERVEREIAPRLLRSARTLSKALQA